MTTLQSADKSALDKLVSSLRTPVFLAGIDEGSRPCLTLHTARSGAGRNLRREAEQALARSGISVRCKVRVHSARRLEKDSSLDRLVRRFRHDSIVFDPTGGVGRSQAIVRCAAIIRGALGDGVAGIYLEPWRRTLYVVLHRGAVVRDGEVAFERVQAIESALAGAVRQALGDVAGSFALRVRVGPRPPSIPVVPVDHASLRPGRGHPDLARKLRTGSVVVTVAAFFGLGVAGSAMAEGPAVSQPNSRIAAKVGAVNSDAAGFVSGAATFPLGYSYGAQVDGLLGGAEGDVRWGLAGHLFWRDPEEGLLGFKTSVYGNASDTFGRTGVEGELYLGQYTAGARAGYQYGDFDDGLYGRFDLRWYATDDFMLRGGGLIEGGDFVAKFKTEYQPGLSALPGLSLFADAEIGTDDRSRVLAGVRIYFGGEVKSLIRRHREDDPDSTDEGGEGSTTDEGGDTDYP